jgi:hypothetical protein
MEAQTREPTTLDEILARARDRRRRFEAAREPPPRMVRVPCGFIVRIVPREQANALWVAPPKPPKPLAVFRPPPPPPHITPAAMLDYLAKDALYDVDLSGRNRAELPTVTLLRDLLRLVAKARHFSVDEMCSQRRWAPLALARHEFSWLAYRHSTRSLPEMGRALGGRDHTTILHGIRRFQKRIDAGEDCRTLFLDDRYRVVRP